MVAGAIRVGMCPMLVEGGAPEANRRRAAAMVGDAARRGCQAAVLPECLDLGWTDPAARPLAQPVPGPHCDVLAAAARQHGLHVAAGLVERSGERLFHAAVLINPRGSVLLKHRKLHALAIAHDLYAVGDRLAVFETPLGTLAVDLGADNFPESLAIGPELARMGAQALSSPSAWAVAADHGPQAEPYGRLSREAYGELGRLHDVPVIGVSGVGRIAAGPWQGRTLIGCSLATAGRGEVLAVGPYGEAAEAVIVVDVPLRQPTASGDRLDRDLAARGYAGP
jgi:predicted amidohydrolase